MRGDPFSKQHVPKNSLTFKERAEAFEHKEKAKVLPNWTQLPQL